MIFAVLAIALAPASAALAAPFAYVSNAGSGSVSVIDGTTNAVVATVTVGSSPTAIAVNPAGTRAYVINAGSSSLSVIDTATNLVTATVPLADGSMPFGVAVSPDNSKVYVANGDGSIAVINAATNTPGSPILTSGALGGIAALGTSLYVTDFGGSNVIVIDTLTNAQKSITFPLALLGMGIAAANTPSGQPRVYVPYGAQNSDEEFDLNVAIIDPSPSAPALLETMPVGTLGNNSGAEPNGAAVVGNRLYVTVTRENSVAAIDLSTTPRSVVNVPVGASPIGVASDGVKVFVGNSASGNVSIIGVGTNSVAATVTVGTSPRVIGVFVADVPSPSPLDPGPQPSPGPAPTCDEQIAKLQKKVSNLRHRHGPAWLKAALYARGAAENELKLALKKVGPKDSRYLRAMKELKDGDKFLCADRYWRAKHEYWEAFDIAHRILRGNNNRR